MAIPESQLLQDLRAELEQSRGSTDSKSAAFGDINNDGFLDLYVANSGGGPNELFINDKNGKLIKVTTGDAVTGSTKSYNEAFGDINNDGFLDLYVVNFGEPNELFISVNKGILTKITTSDAVTGSKNSYSAAFGDINNDGFLDLYVANSKGGQNELLINDKNGKLTKVTTGDAVTGSTDSYSAAFGDINNDGFFDLYVANKGEPNELFINKNGTLTKVTTGDAITGSWASRSAAFGDINNDGFLDLYVANNLQPNELFINKNGTLIKVTTGDAVTGSTDSYSAAFGDINNDGFLDLYIANRGQPNELFINDKNGKLIKVTTGDAVTGSTDSKRAAFGDINNDGFLDLYVANDRQPNELFINDKNGKLIKVTTGDAVTGSTWSYSAAFGDINNDGFLDLYVANDRKPNELFINDKNGKLIKVTTGDAVTGSTESYSAAFGDINNDGFIDLYVANSDGPNELYVNDPCPSGFAISSWATWSTCYACPGFSTDFALSPTKCQRCPAGTILPAGMRAAQADQRYLCIPCAAGKYRPLDLDVEACEVCPAGQYAAAGAASCQSCDVGRVTDTPSSEATTCVACAPGKQPNQGRTQCENCTGSTYSQFGVKCLRCPNSMFVSMDRTACLVSPCAPGNVCRTINSCTQRSDCVKCPPGTIATSSGTCRSCATEGIGKVSNALQTACDSCMPGQEPSPDLSQCVTCPTCTAKDPSNNVDRRLCETRSDECTNGTTK
eukprot:SAG25_NODE_1226_length_3564_cov_50.411684_1_plen_728_part_10